MNDPDIRTIVRQERRRADIGAGDACASCGGLAHLLRQPDGSVLCYADRRARAGLSTVEEHHVAGRRNLGGLTVDLRSNDHATVTEILRRLGVDDWPPADGEPLAMLAHLLVGIGALLVLAAEWLLEVATARRDANGGRPFPVVA